MSLSKRLLADGWTERWTMVPTEPPTLRLAQWRAIGCGRQVIMVWRDRDLANWGWARWGERAQWPLRTPLWTGAARTRALAVRAALLAP